MDRLRDPRGRAALVFALVLPGLIAASRSSAELSVVHSSPADATAVESIPTLLITASDRPALSGHVTRGEGKRVLWVVTVGVPALGKPAAVTGSVRSSPSVLAAGPVAHGLAGRGPPISTNA